MKGDGGRNGPPGEIQMISYASSPDEASWIPGSRQFKVLGSAASQNSKWPSSSLRVAYEVGAARQQTVRSPRTMYPQLPKTIGTRTARRRCICQHKAETGLGLMAGLRTESC